MAKQEQAAVRSVFCWVLGCQQKAPPPLPLRCARPPRSRLLLQGRASKRGIAYDAILLETTGLADPAPVAFTFFANSWISANYRLDSILCLVDAQHLRRVRHAAVPCHAVLCSWGAVWRCGWGALGSPDAQLLPSC